ncbi:MAG: hypothetical protein D6786_05060 [Gammaproteobacteria bacterium]|nr:MAG: hypothetical protein D6786_05060 [Gammaproteobacteria bacterium]
MTIQHTPRRIRGQGMTEYIIIVALIAIAAIAVYSFFGDTLRSQMGAMTQELAGVSGTSTSQAAATQANKAAAEKGHKGLSSFAGSADKQ